MSTNSVGTASPASAATRSGLALRLVCAFCTFEIAYLMLLGVKYVVIQHVDPGKSSLPILNTFVGYFSRGATGGAYVGWFLAAAVVLFCSQATVLLMALRRPANHGFPVLWVVVGGVGLLLRPVTGFLGVQLSTSAARIASVLARSAAGVVSAIAHRRNARQRGR